MFKLSAVSVERLPELLRRMLKAFAHDH